MEVIGNGISENGFYDVNDEGNNISLFEQIENFIFDDPELEN